MLSKLFTRLNQTQSMTQLAQKAFRASPQMNKKPSIGDAVILQSKVSNINQVVSVLKTLRIYQIFKQTFISASDSSIFNMLLERLERVRYSYLNR